MDCLLFIYFSAVNNLVRRLPITGFNGLSMIVWFNDTYAGEIEEDSFSFRDSGMMDKQT